MMRYKSLVLRELEQAQVNLNAIKIGMENKNISEDEVYNRIKSSLGFIESATEKVELEPDLTT